MIAGDSVRSGRVDRCSLKCSIIDAQRDVVFFLDASTRSLIVSVECIHDIVLLFSCVDDSLLETTKKLLSSTQFLCGL